MKPNHRLTRNKRHKRSARTIGTKRNEKERNEGKGTRSWRKLNCAPAVHDKTINSNTCFTPETLLQIRDAYNKNHSSKEQILDTTPSKIQRTLLRRLKQCDTEACWLDEIQDPSVKYKLRHLLFAPTHPKEWIKYPNAWLSNFDIAAVLHQYEISHPHFKLLGPSAIDYNARPVEYGGQCVWNDLCELSLAELLSKGKQKLGISLNLDKHDQGGTHWVSMFVDIPEKTVFYYDSACHPVPIQVVELSNTIKEQGKQLTPPIDFTYIENKYTHQRTNTECGMYSLFFIITMLTNDTEQKRGMTMDEKIALFTKRRIPDKYVAQYRQIYFNRV